MKETARISKLFAALYDGNPWIDVTLAGTLEHISAEQAARKISPERNSIWEIVNHIIRWRLNVLDRIHGKVLQSPGSNYFEPVHDTSERAWQETLKQLEDSQAKWMAALKEFDETDFEKLYPTKLTYYEHIHGILQHDAYHLGQVVLLAKMVGG
jgi:uncharacterized damage-inducible protein DinB